MEKKKERAAACQAGHYRVLQQGGTGKQKAVAEETEETDDKQALKPVFS